MTDVPNAMASDARPDPLPKWQYVGWYLRRISVPGGWIYKTDTGAPALCFVPYPLGSSSSPPTDAASAATDSSTAEPLGAAIRRLGLQGP